MSFEKREGGLGMEKGEGEGKTPEENVEEKEKFPNNEWVTLEVGTKVRKTEAFAEEGETEEKRTEEMGGDFTKFTKPLPDDFETWDANNGILARIDKEGKIHVTAETPERRQALEDSDYEKGNRYGVPFSNNLWEPADPEFREKWGSVKEESKKENEERRRQEHLEAYREAAEEKGLEEVGEDWLMADRMEAGRDDRTYEIQENTDGYNIPPDRLEQVGTYDINNDIVAFVDQEGYLKVAPVTDDRMEALKSANYEKGDLGVPLSNGEMPTDSERREEWEQMLEEAKEEQE